MIPEVDKPAVARVMRIAPSDQPPTSSPQSPSNSPGDNSGPAVDKDGLTKKQRQNRKRREKHREVRAREEAIRQSQLRAHQRELETIRLNSQIQAAERRPAQTNVWEQTGHPSMEESVYTIRNLSEENLTTAERRSDGATSEEGWQEVTSKAAKKAAVQKSAAQKGEKPGVDKAASATDGSEDTISSLGDSEDGAMLTRRAPHISSNSFANLDS